MAVQRAGDRGPGPIEARALEVRDVFEGRYREYQYRFVEFFTEHLSDVSRSFGGDLQAMLVLAMIGQVWIKALTDPATDRPENVERGAITASRLADVTGIPRETVRRKLSLLAKKGWIAPTPSKAWHIVVRDERAVAREDLSELDQRAITRVARLFAELETMLASSADTRDTLP